MMSIDHGALATALHAAAGDDPALMRELRQAFVDSAHRQIDLMARSRCDANWQYSCLRLKGLAASFDALALLSLADEAAGGAPGDPVVLRKLGLALTEIREAKLD
jgi:HPt (histidine-containing phosphotransfer) domain-containing protein